MKKTIVTTSAAATAKEGAKLARSLKTGRVIALEGNLGAGKTVFVKGFAEGLGVKAMVQSPTFVLMRVYDVLSKKITRMAHVDCYRLSGPHELYDIGVADYIADPESVVLIEWAHKVRKFIPDNAIWVTLEHTGETTRKVTIDE